MSKAQVLICFLVFFGTIGVALVGLSMCLCKQRTGKWWQ